MASIGSRLKKRRKELEISVEDIAAACGISVQAVYAVERDPERGFNGATLTALAYLLKVNERWLQTGLGPKARELSDEEGELLANFRLLAPEVQNSLTTLAKNMAGKVLA